MNSISIGDNAARAGRHACFRCGRGGRHLHGGGRASQRHPVRRLPANCEAGARSGRDPARARQSSGDTDARGAPALPARDRHPARPDCGRSRREGIRPRHRRLHRHRPDAGHDPLPVGPGPAQVHDRSSQRAHRADRAPEWRPDRCGRRWPNRFRDRARVQRTGCHPLPPHRYHERGARAAGAAPPGAHATCRRCASCCSHPAIFGASASLPA